MSKNEDYNKAIRIRANSDALRAAASWLAYFQNENSALV
jgi:hypothetical protein